MILCLGTTPTVQRTMVFDHLTSNAVNRAAETRESASGKSLNVARVLHTLGREVLATGFVGGDTGKFILDELSKADIPHSFVKVAPRTRTCITVIDRHADSNTELVEEPMPVDERAWEDLRQLVDATLWRAEALVLSGSLPPGAPQDFYAQCVRLAGEAKVPVVLDGRGQPLQLALPYHPLVVKPNRPELAATVGMPIDDEPSLRHAMRRMVEQGAGWVLVTMGAQGAIVSDGKGFWSIPVPRVQAVNPIGSGDSFAAGIIAALLSGEAMPQACILGAACAVANTLTPTPGVVQLEDVKRLQSQIQLQPLA